MTAVASPPSVESGSRLGWYSSSNGGEGALSSANADDVSRMFMPRKHIQRSNSSSSLGSNSSVSSASTVTTPSQDTHAAQNSASESETWSSSKKKYSKNIWPSSKSEPVSGVTNARSQAVPAFSSGPSASSTMSAMHQPLNIVPSQQMPQSSQQNGVRAPTGPPSENLAILILLPMNGTFDRKQINVPYYPDVLRIGRQTNAKTVPTPLNGFFDSKVLSRQHAEVWADKSGKIWIRDVKSSNGTFVNGHRLSPENRESEPHELRESDTLELGIDIVSEDQSTIVHHKVSSKVEHAGTYGTTPSILDLNFGDLDPASGGGLLPSPLSQPLSHTRGRAGSNASSRIAQSVASNQLNALHQQRQMNYWNSPISIEQVVKRLTGELKSAKQQTTDLSQADEFLTTIMKPGYAEKEKLIKPSPLENSSHRQMNGRPKMPRVDSFSRFSDPPAPPPQQPLPEKPDALSRSTSEPFSPLKRSDTEKPKSGTGSPVSRDSSQILNLIEALSSAKREIETHGTRVKELENLLFQEQAARKLAEDKVNELEMRSLDVEVKVENGIVPPPENGVDRKEEQDDPEATVQVNGTHPSETLAPDNSQADAPVEDKTAELQTRLEIMMEEMAEMRKQMAFFKDRAEKAEDETTESRKSLNEMIETLRQERAEKASATALDKKTDTHDCEPSNGLAEQSLTSDDIPTDSKTKTPSMQGSDSVTSQNKDMDAATAATAFATQRHRYNYVQEASPYASMFGVVLLGVGLMAYLNSWQKIDK
ncbi:hypothetical protein CBS147333_2476 [Penicillium roqueforti]|nr:hypothetical protein CBS147332_5430 [Penicillium roqueforti]KAI3113640.1 hypothetical protein CBS147333_2476 [Penicillium roqueforti]KAI3125784.1 hypothetical protein CBS147331_778 [Penicillium roqueforti]KAI3268551.1 hypothetical protein CBS147308_5759 [Penicillium roqueforti]KAI3285863.1 hypothetical protein DTO003C3_7306 [Penicillium roqueforti]